MTDNSLHGPGSGDVYTRLLRIVAWTGAACFLLLPLMAMQFTAEVNWTLSDFVIAGVLVGTAGLLFEVTLWRARSWFYRGGVAVAIGTNFLIIWANGAVGIIGDEGNPANLMYVGVLVVTVLGALLAQFRAHGMARAMVAAAALHLAIATVALTLGYFTLPIDGVFALAWLTAAWLFRQAEREQAVPSA